MERLQIRLPASDVLFQGSGREVLKGLKGFEFATLFADTKTFVQRSLCAERLGDGSSRGTISRGVTGC